MNTTKNIFLALGAGLLLTACAPKGDTDTGDTDTDTTVDTDDTDVVVDGEPRGEANRPTLGAQIDRVGRPAISTALVATFNPLDEVRNDLRDDYNEAGPSGWSDFTDEIQASLAIYDGLDASCGNQLSADAGDERYAFLAGVLADDQLYVESTNATCGVYLGLEGEITGALSEGEGGCGGRIPTDDVIERSYSVLAAGALVGVDDGIAEDDVGFDATFPFLRATP